MLLRVALIAVPFVSALAFMLLIGPFWERHCFQASYEHGDPPELVPIVQDVTDELTYFRMKNPAPAKISKEEIAGLIRQKLGLQRGELRCYMVERVTGYIIDRKW